MLENYYNNLSSDRVFFRKLTYDDIESWIDFYENNTSLKYLGINLNRTNYEMAKAWIDAQIERYDKNEFGQLAMISKETGELIGTRGISFFQKGEEQFLQSMGSIKPAYWRQGFGSEGARCLYNFIFQNKIANKIISICHLDNWISQQYLEKLGFIKQEQLSLENREVFLYILTEVNWQNSKRLKLDHSW